MKTGLPFFFLSLLTFLTLNIQAQYGTDKPSSCHAFYSAQEDPGNHLMIHFQDQSSGNIVSWLWSFGDGEHSELQNPSHLYPGSGLYTVCLTVSNPDTANFCWDEYCDTIYVNITHDCKANFSFVLDSLNMEPNTFIFTDHSTGDPNSWLWMFGDDSLSEIQNPVHRFQTSGNYRVCLLIAETDSTGTLCYDSICQDLITSDYFDLGGHLFAGEYPINNPLSTGDTGLVYLFRMKSNNLIPYDTVRFTQYGYFAFPQKLNGTYLMRAELTQGSVNYSRYFPTYYNTVLTWKSGGTVNLTDSNSYHSDIHLIPTVDTLNGTSAIRGFVVNGEMKPHSPETSFIDVLLFSSHMEPLTFTVTDDAGHFEFPDLPPGTYSLQAEIPGWYCRLTTLTLDAEHVIADSVILEVFDHDITGIENYEATQKISFGNLYPNPAEEQICFDVLSEKSFPLILDILNIAGQIIYTRTIEVEVGKTQVPVQVKFLSKGFYFLLIHSGDGILYNSQKFFRY